MNPNRVSPIMLFAIALMSILPCQAAGQGGWVSTINPGWVSAPAATPAPIRSTPARGGPGPDRRRPVIVLPPPPPSAHVGTPESRQREHPVPVTTRPPATVIHPGVHSDPVVFPYIYAPYGGAAGGRFEIEGDSPDRRIFPGMTRAAVIDVLGRPSAIVYQTSHESLVFSHMTVVIQNGVVALIQ